MLCSFNDSFYQFDVGMYEDLHFKLNSIQVEAAPSCLS